jgi:hypothetical protein
MVAAVTGITFRNGTGELEFVNAFATNRPGGGNDAVTLPPPARRLFGR